MKWITPPLVFTRLPSSIVTSPCQAAQPPPVSERLRDRLAKAALDDRVRVEEHDQIAARGLRAAVRGRRETRIRVVPDHVRDRHQRRDRVGGAVRGGVVDDDQLVRGGKLAQQRGQRPGDRLRAVERDDTAETLVIGASRRPARSPRPSRARARAGLPFAHGSGVITASRCVDGRRACALDLAALAQHPGQSRSAAHQPRSVLASPPWRAVLERAARHSAAGSPALAARSRRAG